MHEGALAVRMKALENEHPEVAQSLSVWTYQYMNDTP